MLYHALAIIHCTNKRFEDTKLVILNTIIIIILFLIVVIYFMEKTINADAMTWY